MSERWVRNVKKKRHLLIALNVGAAALVGLGALAGAKGSAFALVGPGAKDLHHLEDAAARDPNPDNLNALANGYLDAKQPGMAVSLLERNREVQTPEVSLTRARAYYANGHATQALETANDLVATCSSAAIACPPWVSATALADQAYFSELVTAGVEDAASQPGAAQAAFTRSRHEIHLVAIR